MEVMAYSFSCRRFEQYQTLMTITTLSFSPMMKSNPNGKT